jgi:hypothetical protein
MVKSLRSQWPFGLCKPFRSEAEIEDKEVKEISGT